MYEKKIYLKKNPIEKEDQVGTFSCKKDPS